MWIDFLYWVTLCIYVKIVLVAGDRALCHIVNTELSMFKDLHGAIKITNGMMF